MASTVAGWGYLRATTASLPVSRAVYARQGRSAAGVLERPPPPAARHVSWAVCARHSSIAVDRTTPVSTNALPRSDAQCRRHSSTGMGEGRGETPGSDAAGSPTPNFEDIREAYRSKSFSELLRQYVVFKAFTFKILVDKNKAVSSKGLVVGEVGGLLLGTLPENFCLSA